MSNVLCELSTSGLLPEESTPLDAYERKLNSSKRIWIATVQNNFTL